MVTSGDLATSNAVTSGAGGGVQSATWFIPYFDHLAFGGIFTVFRFIEGFARRGVANRVVIYDNPLVDAAKMTLEIRRSFPSLVDSELVVLDAAKKGLEALPHTDIAVCTFWPSAYVLLRFNSTRRKYYFIQDYEPLFYEAGSTYALAESTYRMGYLGIVNTPGLYDAVQRRHGLDGVSFVPAVDSRYYFPGPVDRSGVQRVRIFFYARPNNPRNAFLLGILIIERLLSRYGDRIEVVTAGSEWDEADYGLKGRITNLGLLKTLQEVGSLYRSCDIGFVYMLSKHPSYQPFEFMACGMATVTNVNEDNLWFLEDGKNCLLAEPSPAAMAERIGWLIDDASLRRAIASNGVQSISHDWDRQIDNVWDYVANR